MDFYLRGLHGRVMAANFGYPDGLLLDVIDGKGQKWRFSTWDSAWEPHDPEAFLGHTLTGTSLDDTGRLHMEFEGELVLTVTPGEFESWDDPPYWEILTPDGQTVEYGPGPSWRVKESNAAPPTKAA